MHAQIPTPNENVAITVRNKILIESIFKDTGLDISLEKMERSQGNSVATEIIALEAN